MKKPKANEKCENCKYVTIKWHFNYLGQARRKCKCRRRGDCVMSLNDCCEWYEPKETPHADGKEGK